MGQKKTPHVDIHLRVGVTVSILRKMRGMTQAMLAERAGVRQSSISMIENEHRNTTRLNLCMLQSIAHVLGYSLSELIYVAESASTDPEQVKAHMQEVSKSPQSDNG